MRSLDLRYFFSSRYLLEVPDNFKYQRAFLLTYLLVLLGISLLAIIFKFKTFKRTVYAPFRKMFFWGNLVTIFAGLFYIFSRQQGLPLFSTRIFNFLVILIFLILNISLLIYYKKIVSKRALKELERERIAKWLPKNKKA